METDQLQAGVIGASGIGKHHAKWLDALGCEVSFAGTSRRSVGETKRNLENLFGFSGNGYVGAERMLGREKPDIAVISSPPQLHFQHFMLAIEHGCHIFCEKPPVWDNEKQPQELLQQAEQMVQAAEESGIVAAVNTQYVAAVEPYLRLCEQTGKDVDIDTFTDFRMRMDSGGGGEARTGRQIWIDLAPHPISVLTAFAGPGEIVPDTANGSIHQSRVEVAFHYLTTERRRIYSRITTCHVPEGKLTRSFGIDDVMADYEGRDDENGVYSAFLELNSEQLKATDFVQTSITRFVNAVRGQGQPLVSISDGLQNLQMQIGLLQAARS